MNMKIITLIALALGCLAVFGIANMTDDSDAAVVNPSTGTQVGDLYYTFSGTNATVVGISSSLSSATSITIPDTVESGGTTYNVTAIAASVFMSMTTLETVTFSQNLTSIGANAFFKCTSLALTELPSSLVSIGSGAFGSCTSLALTELPSSLVSIGSGAFGDCTSLESLSIPLATTTVENYAFNGCTNLTLSLDVSVTAGTETDTVSWETGLSTGTPNRRVTTPMTYNNLILTNWTYNGTDYNGGDSIIMSYANRSITANIDPNTYGTCGDNLSWILYADYVLTITGSGAMTDYSAGSPAPWNSYATSIVSLSLPEGMTTYGDYAFYGCTGLSGILAIPSAITHIGDSAFYDCGYSAMIIEGSPTLTDATDPTFGSSDDHSFLEVLNLGDTAIEAGQYGLPDDAVVSDCIPLLGYVAPTSFSETVQKEGAAYDLMKIIPVIIILAVLVMAATAVIKRD